MQKQLKRSAITPGITLLGIGCIHQLTGVLLAFGVLADPNGNGSHSSALRDLFSAGFFNQVGSHADRSISFWFLLFGFMMLLAGLFLHRIESTGGYLSIDLAVALALLCAVGVMGMPLSGFWLGFVPSFQIWQRAKAAAEKAGIETIR